METNTTAQTPLTSQEIGSYRSQFFGGQSNSGGSFNWGQSTPQTTKPLFDTSNPNNITNPVTDYVKGVGSTYANAPKELSGDVNKIAKGITSSQPGKVDTFGQMIGKTGNYLNLMGDSLKAVFAPVTQAVQSGVKTAGDVIGSDKTVQRIASSPAVSHALDFINNKSDELNQIAQEHPEAAKAIQSLATIAGAFMAEPGLQKTPQEIMNGALEKVDAGSTEPKAPVTEVPGGKPVVQQTPSQEIENKTMGRLNTIYKGGEGVITDKGYLNPDIAKNMISDAQSTLEKAGIDSKGFTESIDPENTTPAEINAKAQKLLQGETAPIEETPPTQGEKPTNNARQIAEDSIKNPLTAKEQQSAVGQGRAKVGGFGKEISYEPDFRTKAMNDALEPLANEGKIVSPKTPEDVLNNVSNVQDEISSQGQQIRQGLSKSDAIWNSNELKGRLNDIEPGIVLKSDDALGRQTELFKEGILKLADEADKHAVGLLDLRQGVDDLINQDFGKNFFDVDKNATAFRQYVYNVRDELNSFAADKLPEGNLPDGTSYTNALKNQSTLINAKDQMAEKFAREYPEGSTATSRFFKAHPMIRRYGMRTVMQTLGIGALGLTVGALAKKLMSSSK